MFFIAAAVAALLAAAPALAGTVEVGQLQQAVITAAIVDARQTPVPGAHVSLTDPLGAELQRLTTGALGLVVFAAVPPGRYQLRTETAGAPSIQLPVTVAGSLPLEITVRIPAAVTDRVVVTGTVADEPSWRGGIAGESIRRVPVRVRSRALQHVLGTFAGWAMEDNGLLHARGVDDGFLFVVDGVPVYERLDALSGLPPDVGAIGSVNVITGYVPPEFGYKAGGVIEVRSATVASWSGTADVSVGNDRAREASVVAGGRVGEQSTVRAGAAAAASERYLDPIHPDNLHNCGELANAFSHAEWVLRPGDRLALGGGYGRSLFDVPNRREQDRAGQDQRQRIGQLHGNASWQHTWSAALVTHAAGYHRRTSSRLDGSRFDVPLEAHAERSLARSGILLAVTSQQGAHLLKAGAEWQRLSLDEAFQFAITDREQAEEAGFRHEALRFTPAQPFEFRGRATPRLWSFYVQDTWQARPRLTFSGGVRFDRSELLLTRTQWSPRLGAALRASEQTVIRAALSRFFQPPQPENLLLSSSRAARVLSSIVVDEAEGGADLEPERQWGSEIGLEHRAGRVRLDLAYWRRRIENAADPNVFAGTTVIFPNAVAQGRAQGLEMRVEVPRIAGWSGYANWAVAKVVQTGPINGGLFLEDEVEEIGPGVEFSPDHDQRFTAGGGVTWEHVPSGGGLTLTARYETGTPVQQEEGDIDELLDQPGADRVDFAAGRVKPRTVVSLLASAPVFSRGAVETTLGVQILNLFDARYAYNFGNPFSGTHFGAPRTFAANLRVRFR